MHSATGLFFYPQLQLGTVVSFSGAVCRCLPERFNHIFVGMFVYMVVEVLENILKSGMRGNLPETADTTPTLVSLSSGRKI